MNLIRYFLVAVLAMFLAACGGGGGSAGNPGGVAPPPPVVNALFTTAPASLTTAVGAAQEFSITGGTSPYSAVSNDASVVIAGVNGGKLTIGGIASGTAAVSVRDAAGASVAITVTVRGAALRDLFTTAAASVVISIGQASAQTYNVGGGTGPYTVTSNNVSVVSAVLTGNSLTLTGISVGSANIVIRDNAGASITVAVTVQPVSNLALFTTAPSTITVMAGTAPTYMVGGGTGPYTAISSNTSVAAANLSGTTLTVTGVAAGSANIVVRDNAGASTTVAVTVLPTSNVALFTTAPASVTVAAATAPTYAVGGGTGPYTTTSSNTSVAAASLVGSTLTVTGVAAGSANIVVRDSAGASTTVEVTVQSAGNLALFTTAPASVTVGINTSQTYSVGGGSGSGYLATSTNIGVVTASLTGTTLTVTGVAVGSANVVVRDSAGAIVTVGVSVGTVPLAVTPNNATGIVEDVLIATITGGTPPYRRSVGNIVVASATIQNTNELAITLLQSGSTIVTVLDANNQSVGFTVTSSAPTPGTRVRLSPSAVTISELDAQPILFTVFGTASGVVNVFSSDVTLLNATIAADNRTVTVTTGTKGNRCVSSDLGVTITVIDSIRATAVATVTIRDNGNKAAAVPANPAATPPTAAIPADPCPP